MAQLPCDNHPELEAAFIVGETQTGKQSFFCPLCTGVFGLAMALATLDPADVKKAAEDELAKVASNGQEPPAKTPAPKSKAGQPRPRKARVSDVAKEAGTEPASDAG